MALSKIDESSWGGRHLGGRRNIITNGGMQVWQRATSVASTSFSSLIGGASGNKYFAPDRWFLQYYGLGSFNPSLSVERSTDHPTGRGYSLKLNCTSGSAIGTANTEFQSLKYRIEGQDCTGFINSVDAQSATLSFWVKTNQAGTYTVSMRVENNTSTSTALLLMPYTISSSEAGSWKQVTLSVPAYTYGDPTSYNDQGVSINWYLASTINAQRTAVDQSSVDACTNQWGANFWGDGPSVTEQVNFWGTTGNYFMITDVQLEVGQKTPFESRSYGEELSLCQRYYEKCGSGIVGGTSSNMSAWNSGVTFKVEKRTSPSVTHLANFNAITPGSNQHTVSVSTIHSTTPWGACLTHTASGSAGSNQCWLYYESSNNIAFDAEL